MTPPETERERVLRWLDALRAERMTAGDLRSAAEVDGFSQAAEAVFSEPALLMTTVYALAAAAWRLTQRLQCRAS